MGISRATVNSYLADARARGIVNISLEPSRLSSLSIAQELKRHFGLHDCLVVPSDDNARPLIDRLGGAAAQALAKLLKSGDTLAVAWGRTVLAIGEQASVPGLQDVTVVQATGGTRASFAYTPELCAAAIAGAVNGKADQHHRAGDRFHGRGSRHAVARDADRKPVRTRLPKPTRRFSASRRCVRIRRSTPAASSNRFRCSSISPRMRWASSPAASSTGRAIRCAGPLDDRTIGISLDMLKTIGLRIAVAGGFDKVPAILAALRGGYVNVLITDAATGRGILNADGVTELDQKLSQRPKVDNTVALPSNYRTHIKKFLNDPDDVVEEMLDGVVKAHAAYIKPIKGSHRALVARTGPRPGKVGLVIGGGIGTRALLSRLCRQGPRRRRRRRQHLFVAASRPNPSMRQGRIRRRRRALRLRQLCRRRDEFRNGGRDGGGTTASRFARW